MEAGGDNIELGRYQRRMVGDEGNFPASGGGRQYGRDGGYTIPAVAVLLAVSSVGYLFCSHGGGCYSWTLEGEGVGVFIRDDVMWWMDGRKVVKRLSRSVDVVPCCSWRRMLGKRGLTSGGLWCLEMCVAPAGQQDLEGLGIVLSPWSRGLLLSLTRRVER